MAQKVWRMSKKYNISFKLVLLGNAVLNILPRELVEQA